MGCGVRGVVLDESVLFGVDDESGNSVLQQGLEYLLRKLQFSGLRTSLLCGASLTDSKASCIGKITALYSVGHFKFVHDIKAAWGDITDNILYLVSKTSGNQNLNLSSCSWIVTILEAGGTSLNEHNAMSISRLEELPLTICRINKKAMCGHTVTVGYIMKSSRETDFAKATCKHHFEVYTVSIL